MLKIEMSTLAPLGIIAATLISLAVFNSDKPDSLLISTAHEQVPHKISAHGNTVRAERLAKPGVQIELEGILNHHILLNQESAVDIVLTTQLSQGILDIVITADEGIELVSEQRSWHFDLSENPSIILPLTLLARTNGQYYLNIFTQYSDANGNQLSRALASEISVGKETQAAEKIVVNSTSPTPSKYISLPSQETIF